MTNPAVHEGPSDFIGGAFREAIGEPLVSVDPAHDGRDVVRTKWSAARVDEAVASAKEAQPAWSRLSLDERLAHLLRFRAVLEKHKELLADAIVREIGKIRSEARVEIQTVLGRFDLVAAQIKSDMKDGALPGFPNEALRWHPHGVVAVIGPFNFPLHLCHAHVVPALLLGNTVVMKPSEVAPLCGIRYAECAREAGLPPGVLNVIHGKGPTGARLVSHPDTMALAFTGSWPVGRRIAEAVLDKPEMLVALEMGGKNTVVVCEDADLRQAAHELVVGGYLTTGQRCTCTDRVLVHRSRAKALVDALRPLVSGLVFGDPDDARAFAGPLATEAGRDKLERAMMAAQAAGADQPVVGQRLPGGFFRTGSFHVLPEGVHDVSGYTDVELFGPDLGIEIVGDDDEAIATINGSPYGFANSVFTASDARFDRYYRETRCGILNRNRSTNQASPRLPFGGTGRSGNFRPAGSFAPRNLAIPVAVQKNGVTSFPMHASLRASLPLPELDRMEQAHASEEAAEASRSLIDTPRPSKPLLPAGGALPASTEWLERLHAGERVPREKKPPVFDHLRSHGPWMVSVDAQPLAVLDAMSQTATMPFGFADDALVRAYAGGELGTSVLAASDITAEHGPGREAADAYAATLRKLVPGLPTVSFAACGAEANEKAYALCRAAARASAKKLMAFEGSFHGRTLLALYASHSPSKRVPFEIAGYEVDFAPFPRWDEPNAGEPSEPPGLADVCARADVDELLARFGKSDDALLRAEVHALAHVARHASASTHFAVVIEPMQSEGGDRYATARFHRMLRLVTRALGVALIMDEVQCGFGLGGSFAWHHRFGLRDASGGPDTPDAVVFAKRAQVGVVMSRFPDPEPTSAFAASLVRGRLHAELVHAHADDCARVEAAVRAELPRLVAQWGHRISNVRATGYALAFDLATPAELDAYLGQRFWRGVVVFGAGDRTVRYRLNASFFAEEIALLFRSIRESLAWLEANPGKKAPAWDDRAPSLPVKRDAEIRVRVADRREADVLVPRILELEARVYEPARRDPEHRLRLGFDDADGAAIVAEQKRGEEWALVGVAISAPLERVADVSGPDRDPALGKGEACYSVAITIDPAAQGAGLGRRLKQAQVRAAREAKKADGTPRFRWMTGRNRVGHADVMAHLNWSHGAYTLFVLENQYGENAQALYYRMPLHGLCSDVAVSAPETIDASSLATPFAAPPASLVEAERRGLLAGPATQKLTLVNYVTPAVVRATEWAAALAPDHPHVFWTSGRDETIDKSVRMLRWHRKTGQVVISLDGAYVGHTTACARSVSDPSTHRGGPAHFAFPHVAHPAVVGEEASERAIRDAIAAAGGAASVLGIYVEPVQERTGRTLSHAFVQRLDAIRRETGVPFVFVETASAYYRSGRGAFASSAWRDVLPDALVWWSGGQQGFVHVSAALYVPTPLTFVSTWDGDELSMIQAHHQLRAARSVDVAAGSAALDAALAPLGERARGAGLYRVIEAGTEADALLAKLASRGVRARRFANDHLGLAVPLDRAIEAARAIGAALR